MAITFAVSKARVARLVVDCRTNQTTFHAAGFKEAHEAAPIPQRGPCHKSSYKPGEIATVEAQ